MPMETTPALIAMTFRGLIINQFALATIPRKTWNAIFNSTTKHAIPAWQSRLRKSIMTWPAMERQQTNYFPLMANVLSLIVPTLQECILEELVTMKVWTSCFPYLAIAIPRSLKARLPQTYPFQKLCRQYHRFQHHQHRRYPKSKRLPQQP